MTGKSMKYMEIQKLERHQPILKCEAPAPCLTPGTPGIISEKDRKRSSFELVKWGSPDRSRVFQVQQPILYINIEYVPFIGDCGMIL